MRQQENLTIRPVEERDLAFLQLAQTQEMRGRFQEAQMESMARLRSQWEKDGMLGSQFQMLMVELEGQPVGFVTAFFVREGMVRVGIQLDENCRGQRVGSRAFALLRDYLLENFPLVRLEADTDVDNIAAQKMLERCGFRAEGVLRKYRFHHGSYHDSYLYSYIRYKREQPAQFLACGPLPFLLRWKIKTKC